MQSLAAFTGANYQIPGALDYRDFLRATQICTNDVREKAKAFERVVFDVTWCEGPGGYHQMDVLGEALDIERKHLQQLGIQEAELSAEHVNAIIDKICHHATALSVTAKDKYADQITQTTLKTIHKQINDNVRRLMSL